MGCLVHLERLEDEVLKKVVWRIPEDKRKKGRAIRQWRDAVDEDLKTKRIED